MPSGLPSLPFLTPFPPRAVTGFPPHASETVPWVLYPPSPFKLLESSFLDRTGNLLLSGIVTHSGNDPSHFTSWSREARPTSCAPAQPVVIPQLTHTGLTLTLHWGAYPTPIRAQTLGLSSEMLPQASCEFYLSEWLEGVQPSFTGRVTPLQNNTSPQKNSSSPWVMGTSSLWNGTFHPDQSQNLRARSTDCHPSRHQSPAKLPSPQR